MLKYIFLIQVLCGVLTLANSHSACWMPAKDFSAQDQEPQGKETRHPVHAARRVCPTGKAHCEQGIIKWYPEIVKDINKHKDVQILTYPKNSVGWISSADLKGDEKFLIVGTKDGQKMRLCRSIVRTHTVIGEHLKGETSCTVKIRGASENRKPFELLVVSNSGKSMGMNSKVTECKQKQSELVKHSSAEIKDEDSDDENASSDKNATDDKSDESSERTLKDSDENESPEVEKNDKSPDNKSDESTEGTLKDSDENESPEDEKNAPDNKRDESSEQTLKGSEQNESPKDENSGEQIEIWSDNKGKELSGGHRQHQTPSKQPCWSSLTYGSRKYEELDPIAVTNRNKLYLVRLTSKGNIRFGAFAPSQGKIVSFDGKRFSSENPSVQLLHVKRGSLGWKQTTQSAYRWRLPRNVLIVGKFAGSPYSLSEEPSNYTICRPDVKLGMNNRKVLLGVANSRTGLCTAVLAGQVVYFTRFHVLTQVHGNVKSLNAMEACPAKTPQRGPQTRLSMLSDY